MKKFIFLTAVLVSFSASAGQVCGKISYSTFDNGATTVRLFTDQKAYNVFSTNSEVDHQLRHLPATSRNVCLDGKINDAEFEIDVQNIEIR
jgi:hypothetical protein